MTLLGIHSLSKSFGTQSLFKNISFNIVEGDRIGLIGPNGAGKSTLVKILVDIETPDEGSISKKKGLRIGYASQSPELPSLPIEEILVNELSNRDSFEALTRARIILGKLQFSNTLKNASELSGGWKKRLDFGRALINDPDLLILDEPTNHLDLEGIIWLEKFLLKENLTYVTISHDRYFLERVCNKIIELNSCYPEGLFIVDGNYLQYIEQKNQFLESQLQRQKGLASVVRRETEWLRRSPKARTTKSQSRVKNAEKLINELSQVKERNKITKVDINFSSSDRETRKLMVANNICKSLGHKLLFKGIDLTLSPGTRLGIVGKNGTGKTTLLKVLAQLLPQDLGTIKYAEDLKIVYFDQHREQLDLNLSLREALSPVGDMVNYRGVNIHVNGWAQKFLFSPDRLELPLRCLSGGERARILIARLMLEPADILFLDEPTNDLDIETLEIIEDSLNDFTGAVVLISHDRFLMDNVCNLILGLGNDKPEFFADYSQWESFLETKEPVIEKNVPSKIKEKGQSQKKLSWKEQKELEGMVDAISNVEETINLLQKKIDEHNGNSISLYEDLAKEQAKLDSLFHRWEELNSLKDSSS